MSLVVTILGCGSSGGVPRLGPDWGACDPSNPKNVRRRCSCLVEKHGPDGTTRILVDASPDLRMQLLDVRVGALDAVLLTHEHADHTHGIDDLRPVALKSGRRVPVYMDGRTHDLMHRRFGYCFAAPPGSLYPPILDAMPLDPGRQVRIEGAGGAITALPFLQEHGDISSLGFRFDSLAYSSDLNDLPRESFDALRGLDVWVVDALRDRPHSSHFTVAEALAWIERMAPRRAVLTNLHVDLDYEALRARLPAHVEPAYDNMRIELASTS